MSGRCGEGASAANERMNQSGTGDDVRTRVGALRSGGPFTSGSAEDPGDGVTHRPYSFGAVACRAFFTGAGLPLFVLTAVVIYEAFLLAIIFVPGGPGAWGEFTREFKLWCFDYDSRTGGMSWAAVGVMLVEPPFVAGIALLLWRRALGALRTIAGWARHWRAVLAGAAAAAFVAGSLFAYGRPSNADNAVLPFPGERIRTTLTPPAFHLADQRGAPFALEDLRGRVVLMTGIYAMCSATCPEILREIRELLDTLPAEDRARLSVVAFSLNPEYETTELMSALAAGYGFTHPEFRYLNGDPKVMHELLPQLAFSRYRDPNNGVISHSNLFILVDADGRIAYRLALDPKLRPWLREAVLQLTAEAGRGMPQ